MKAVEWWLLFHIVVPFILFIVLFLNEHKTKKGAYNDHEKTKFWLVLDNLTVCFVFFGKFILPAVIALFVMGFTIIVLIQY